MKRGGPLKRTTPLKRSGELKRTSLQRKPPATGTAPEVRRARRLRAAWKRGTRGKPCANCGVFDTAQNPIQAHHIITKQFIKWVAGLRGSAFDTLAWLWDPRNRLPLCRRCHGAHHARLPALTRGLLRRKAPQVFEFARDLGPEAEERLKLDYPENNHQRRGTK